MKTTSLRTPGSAATLCINPPAAHLLLCYPPPHRDKTAEEQASFDKNFGFLFTVGEKGASAQFHLTVYDEKILHYQACPSGGINE